MTLTNSESKSTILSRDGETKESLLVRFPVRFVLTFFLCMGTAIAFSHRVTLNIAIVAMVNSSRSSLENNNSQELVCPYTHGEEEVKEDTRNGEFTWSPATQGVVLGAFFYGYVLTQVLGGLLAERFAPKFIFVGGIVASSILTLLVPVVAEFSFGLFIALRVVNGAAQGFAFPAYHCFISNWFPNTERGLHLAIVVSGAVLGTIISLPIVGYLCEKGFAGGWPSAFYVFGIVGLVYAVPFCFFVYSTPEEHPRISPKELAYLQEGVPKKQKQMKLSVPWVSAITSIPIWALTFSKMSTSFAFYIIMSKIPAYMDSILHYPIQQNGLLNSILYVLEIISHVFSGFLSDLIQTKGWLSTNATRKLFQAIASSGAGVCMLAVPFVECDGTFVIVLLTASLGILGLNSGGEMPVIGDMAPAFSGSLYGLTNTFSSSSGYLAPLVAGLLLGGNDRSMTQWSYVFYFTASFSFAGCLVFLFLAEAKLQPWAVVKKDSESEAGQNGYQVENKNTDQEPEKY